MNNSTAALWGIVLIIIVGVGGWYLLSRPNLATAPAETTSPGGETSTTTEPSAGMPIAPVTVTYTDQGFSPASVTIVEGQTVTWVNQSSKQMWVASAMHPTHAVYDGTSRTEHCAGGAPVSSAVFDQCSAGAANSSFSFTFTKAGEWKYHDHMDATKFGTIVVSGPETSVSVEAEVNAQ